MLLPPMTNAVPSPSNESAEWPLVSRTARAWMAGVGDVTGGTAMMLAPAMAKPALTQQRWGAQRIRVLWGVRAVLDAARSCWTLLRLTNRWHPRPVRRSGVIAAV